MNEIKLESKVYTDSDIVSGTLYAELSPISETLGYGTLEAEVRAASDILQYKKNSPLTYWHDGILMGTYYVQRIKRTGQNKYAVSAIDALGLLANRKHYGGIYTGQIVSAVVADICGEIPATVKTLVADTRLYGWLPIAACRDNLRHVLFAIGCIARIDNNGVIRIEGLWDGVSHSVNKISLDASADYPSPVTVVKLTEHQYMASEASESETLFEGITAEGERISFDEPMHSLTATGVDILESGANYAIVSAGNGTVEGKRYIHTTKELTDRITESQDENEASYEEETLVSLVNSRAVLDRLKEYHKHPNTVTGETRQNMQRCGDVANISHPYDKTTEAACIQTNEITISGALKAAQTYLMGYLPPKESNNFYDAVEIIDAGTTWVVPDGVTSIRAILIGGGTGGTGGSGGNGCAWRSGNAIGGTIGPFDDDGIGPSGGAPGTPGKGGKILDVSEINVQPGDSFVVQIGTGGTGGAGGAGGQEDYESDTSVTTGQAGEAGSVGSHTTFGAYSSENGYETPNGFLESVSGSIFAADGESGYRGGNGGGTANGPSQGESLYGQSGGLPGANKSDTGVFAQGGGGGGSAFGGDGFDGTSATSQGKVTINGASYYSCHVGFGGNGASAAKAAAGKTYGTGGQGGHGGGGAGNVGGARGSNTSSGNGAGGVWRNNHTDTADGGGGQGGAGGDGAPGCIILYYRKPRNTQSGAVVDKNNKYVTDKLGRYVVV